MKMSTKRKGGKGRPKSKKSSSSRSETWQEDYSGFFSNDEDTKEVASNGYANHELVSVFENSLHESHSKDDTSTRTMNRFGGMALSIFLEDAFLNLQDSSFLQTVSQFRSIKNTVP